MSATKPREVGGAKGLNAKAKSGDSCFAEK
jgi:hypothetical protein